jgi:hypothetical protein
VSRRDYNGRERLCKPRLASEARGFRRAFVTRNPGFDIPLKDNARYQALKAKLEAQMAAYATELGVQ